ncbi:MAG TPA: RusA family crossover junction endodeoxyribonuclease, partial [Polyangiaceae bacterium]|nr:RusA family crossover junction endodeoxyribonuclease [Polyangiaceae bacterium]
MTWFGLPVPTKNSRDIVYSKAKKRFVTMPSTRARSWMNAVIQHLLGNVTKAPPVQPFPDFGSDELECIVELDYIKKETRVHLRRLWPKPKRNTGRKCDVDNLLCSVFDALHRGGVIGDDRQIGIAHVHRITAAYQTHIGSPPHTRLTSETSQMDKITNQQVSSLAFPEASIRPDVQTLDPATA